MKKKLQQKNRAWYQNGFTLLFATLVASLLLSLGISILDITLQNYILSSTGRESQYAFYAADSGLECALYWDRKYTDTNGHSGSAFPLASNDPNAGNVTPATSVSCNGSTATFNDNSINWSPIYNQSFSPTQTNGQYATTTTYISFPADPTSGTTECYTVEVDKTGNETSTGSPAPNYVPPTVLTHTFIKSRGYNTCDTTNLRRLERGIEIDF
jgi:Tfp pilus assembly protein PilX